MNVPITYHRKMISKSLHLRFFPTDDLLDSKNFNNIRKVRCIILNDQKCVCMVSKDELFNWMLPGGTIEHHENPIIALRREVREEADIEIKNYKLVGFLEFKIHNHITGYKLNRTEMIFVAQVDKILPQTEDPAFGYVLNRDFLDMHDALYNYVKWGKISKYLEEHLMKLKWN